MQRGVVFWKAWRSLSQTSCQREFRRSMGGPSSHLKQLKGLVRKAHLTLPLEHTKVQLAAVEDAHHQVEAMLRAYDMEHMPRCDRKTCQNSPEGLWCSFPVAFPSRNWKTVFHARGKAMRELDANASVRRRVRKFVLPEELMIYQPGSRKRTGDGVDKLAMSMMDNVLSVDMQWNTPGSKVGILQVASSTFSLLVRGPKYWDRGMPNSLAYFLRDPPVMTVGFGFGEVEQQKLRESFNWGMEDFSNFIDLQALAGMCGYPSDISLSTLARKVLGAKLHIEPDFNETDWEEERLTTNESFFASLSVFTIGQIFRQLRHWHALPKRCHTCRQELGIFYDHRMQCAEETCPRDFSAVDDHRKHCLITGHPYHSQLCPACYRIRPISDQMRVDGKSLENVPVEKMSVDEGVGREVLQEMQRRRLHQSNEGYKERLVSCADQLIPHLYGDLNEVAMRSSDSHK